MQFSCSYNGCRDCEGGSLWVVNSHSVFVLEQERRKLLQKDEEILQMQKLMAKLESTLAREDRLMVEIKITR